MHFSFSISKTIKEVWPIYKVNFGLLTLLTATTLALNAFFQDSKFLGFVLSVFSTGLVTYIWIKYSLGLLDDKYYDLFNRKMFPTLLQYFNLTKTIILAFFLIIISLPFLVFPAFYIGGRIVFSPFISMKKNQGAIKSITDSWLMTRNNGWILFWKNFIVIVFILAGSLVFGIGILITFPIGYLVTVKMFKEFELQFNKNKNSDSLSEANSDENKESAKE